MPNYNCFDNSKNLVCFVRKENNLFLLKTTYYGYSNLWNIIIYVPKIYWQTPVFKTWRYCFIDTAL